MKLPLSCAATTLLAAVPLYAAALDECAVAQEPRQQQAEPRGGLDCEGKKHPGQPPQEPTSPKEGKRDEPAQFVRTTRPRGFSGGVQNAAVRVRYVVSLEQE